jgi:hypothetical protein
MHGCCAAAGVVTHPVCELARSCSSCLLLCCMSAKLRFLTAVAAGPACIAGAKPAMLCLLCAVHAAGLRALIYSGDHDLCVSGCSSLGAVLVKQLALASQQFVVANSE